MHNLKFQSHFHKISLGSICAYATNSLLILGYWVEKTFDIRKPGQMFSTQPYSFSWNVFLFCYWRREWQPIPVLLPGKSHGRRSLVGCSSWSHEESDTTELLHFHFSLSCIGEGNGNSIQYSCLENPKDRGAWWAAIYGVTQSQTRLKQLSSSSSPQTWRW